MAGRSIVLRVICVLDGIVFSWILTMGTQRRHKRPRVATTLLQVNVIVPLFKYLFCCPTLLLPSIVHCLLLSVSLPLCVFACNLYDRVYKSHWVILFVCF